MAKKVALITAFSSVAEVHRRTLEMLFRNTIELQCYSYDLVNITGPIDADLFLISIHQIYLNVKQYIPRDAKTIIISNTIEETQYQVLAALPPGSSVLLVNYSVEMTMDTLSLFHRLGLNQVEFVPFYPGITNAPSWRSR